MPARGWPRAAGLLVVTLAVSAMQQPLLLMTLPFLALLLGMGRGDRAGLGVLTVGALAAVLVFSGDMQGLWYVERAWGVLLAGCFVAASMRWPRADFSARALGAVAASLATAAGLLALRSDAWAAVDWAVTDRMRGSVAAAMELVSLLRDGDLSPALVAAVYEAVEAQASIFPAMLAVASMAGLGCAWWTWVRVTSGSDQGIGRLRDFSFNDHLVWVFIGGVVLLLMRWGGVQERLGANAVVFMGLLYAVRGAGVVMFLSGGISLLGYAVAALALLFIPPVALGAAMMIGIGDTWLDVRARAQRATT